MNIAWEIASVQQGFVLTKVHDNNDGKRTTVRQADRFVSLNVVWDSTSHGWGAYESQLKWTKQIGNLQFASEVRQRKMAQLSPDKRKKLDVLRLPVLPELHHECREKPNGFGRLSSSTLNLHDVISIDYGIMSRACILSQEDPWRCFTLNTVQRTYDFVCPDEECARCFVLSLSRFAPWARGAIKSRAAFLARRGWCKVESKCQQEEITLTHLLLKELRAKAVSMSSSAHGRPPVKKQTRMMDDC